MTLTEAQREAVGRRRGCLMVCAGAGSGKTAVLTERLVGAILEDQIAPGRILAMTFTERAAGELLERVRARLIAAGGREAARDIEAAAIGTFHGFCARLLRAHALMAGIDPHFTVLDEVGAGRLRLMSFRDALAEMVESGGEGAVDVVASYGPDNLRRMVEDVYSECRSRGQTEPALPAVKATTDPTQAAVALRTATAAATAVVAGAIATVRDPSQRLLRAADVLEEASELCERLDGGISPAGGRSRSIVVPTPGQLSQLKLAESASGVLGGDACRGYREALAAFTTACADHHAVAVCGHLSVLVNGFSRRYRQLKRARGRVDFDDLELMTRDLLRREEDLRSEWSQRLEMVMVDEFQDTNHRQMQILAMITRDNLFTVGDEMQSIYGFRHADVGIFRTRRLEAQRAGESVTLAQSFRAVAPLVATVNAVFSHHLTTDCIPLVAARHQPAAQGDVAVELLVTDQDGWDHDRLAERVGGRLPLATSWRHSEARLLAQRVSDLLNEAPRSISGSDVVVLLRSVSNIGVYEAALREQGLSTLATVGSFWSQEQVGDVLACLGALANPLDEVALYGTLASPFVGISRTGLAGLAAAARAYGRGLWATIAACCEGARSSGADGPVAGLAQWIGSPEGQRLQRFYFWFDRKRSEMALCGLRDLVESVTREGGYDRVVLDMNSPQRRIANLRKLARLAGRFEADEGRDLRGFLDHVSAQGDYRGGAEPEAPVGESEPDAVRLMSIHAAKGLEFPIVCVADLGRDGGHHTPSLILGSDGRLGLRLAELDGSKGVPALDYLALEAERRDREDREEERIMYVAMTRARDRLILSGSARISRISETDGGRTPLSYLGPALVGNLAERAAAQEAISLAPVRNGEGAIVRLYLNSPQTLGEVLRLESLDPVAQEQSRAAIAPGYGDRDLDRAPGSGDRDLDRVPGSGDRNLQGAVALGVDRSRPLSYTALTALSRCGYRYYLEHELGLPERTPRRVAAADRMRGGSHLGARVRGIVVHRLLQGWDFRAGRSAIVSDIQEASSSIAVTLSRRDRDELVALLGAISQTELARRLGSAVALRREHPFAFVLAPGEQLLTGMMDVVAELSEGALLVVDYKTDRVGPGADLEGIVSSSYQLQRELYALACLCNGAQEVEVVHWFLQRPGEWASRTYVEEDVGLLRAKVDEQIERVEASGFAVSERPHWGICGDCPGRGSLCSWSEAEIRGEAAIGRTVEH